jgi:hypothetical protein
MQQNTAWHPTVNFNAGFSLPNNSQFLGPIREKVNSLICQLQVRLYTNNYAYIKV